VLQRTCYTKALDGYAERAAFWNLHGYAFVVQDVRGRGDSDGMFYPLVAEKEDGSDTIDWIRSQPWSDGNVVMTGGSYAGWTQAFAACSGNTALRALALVATPPDPDRAFPVSHGMISPAAASWIASLDGHVNQRLDADRTQAALNHRPIADFDIMIGRRLQAWRDWVEHVVKDDYWNNQEYQTTLASSAHPLLHVTGWYDDCLIGALENFVGRASFGAGGAQQLVIGPWLHGSIGQRSVGDLDFGEAAEVDLHRLCLDWFNSCLGDGKVADHPVQLFVMGRNEWIYEREWPIARAEPTAFYLHSAGRANSRCGDGVLSIHPPAAEHSDNYVYDPSNPFPYGSELDWKQVGGPDDRSVVELRDDMLVYTSMAFDTPTLICGPVHVHLHAQTDAKDTDWTATLLVVRLDGIPIRLCDGAIRARFRHGHDKEIFLAPGEIVEYVIDCWATCIELKPGERLRLEIASSAFGKYDVNCNGGGQIGKETISVVAQQRVYHDKSYPSHILLSVLPV
jgi:putative CocE/NonD family hydrolase